MKCYKCTWKNCHLRTKLTFFSPLCSKYQWEYACNNTRITLSASRCNKMHTWFWLSFFVVFQTCTEVTMYFVHEDEFSLSHASNVFQILSSCDVNHFHVMRYVKGFQCFNGSFRVYMSLLTLFQKHNWGGCLMLILNGQINACR